MPPANDLRDRQLAPSVRSAIGVYDFSYAPYALGDALTWTMNLNVLAAAKGCNAIDQYLVIDPGRPGCKFQPFVNPLNYVTIFDGLYKTVILGFRRCP